MLRKYMQFTTELEPGQVFVFGSNGTGFHGAGSAGYAMRGTSENSWRDDRAFCDIVYGRADDKRGLWAVYGIARGFQVGKSGASYAVQTVERPGAQGNIRLRDVGYQLRDLVLFARKHPELEFLICKLGATRAEGGYSYFGLQKMRAVWALIHKHYTVPDNCVLPEEVDPRPSSLPLQNEVKEK